MAEPGTFEKVMAEIGQALLPLRDALSSPQRFVAFLIALGWITDDIPAPLAELHDGVETLYDELRRMLGDGGLNVGASAGDSTGTAATSDDVTRVLHAVQEVIAGIRALATAPASAIPAALLADGFATEFPRQLVDYLVITYLQRFHPQVAFGLRALGVVKVVYVPPTGGRPSHMRMNLDLADLPKTISSPPLVLKNAFGWGTADFDFGEFASQIDNVLTSIGLDMFVSKMDSGQNLAITGGTDDPLAAPPTALKALIFQRVTATSRMSADVRLLPLPATGTHLPGFALLPGFDGLMDYPFALTDTMTVTFSSDLDLQGGVGLLVRPGEPVQIIVGFADASAPVSATGSISVTSAATGTPTTATPTVLLGSADSTRLQMAGIGGGGGVRLVNNDIDVFAEFALLGLEFVLDTGGDGFISTILPAGGVTFGTDLTVGISHRDGFYFRGTSHLSIQVPAHARIGPIEIQSLTISANPADDGSIPIGLGATFAADLGPVHAVVDQIGLSAVLKFPPGHDGNLGPVDLSVGFQPPKGVGLAINAGMVTGGGYLSHDPAAGEYAGAIQLSISGVLSLDAVGLISTKLPDGSAGFSLLILVSTEFATGIQLGFGFRLTAIGGLLGLNRGMDLTALTEGVSTGALQQVMFPKDIITNAPKIIGDLKTFFPAQPGTFLVGPMAKLEWGTPTLVTITLGVVLEIPGNIAILGVVSVAVPAIGPKIVDLRAQFIGAIEFDKQRLWFYATLHDSKIAGIPLNGDMGLLVDWSSNSNLLLSVGGFHPAFTVPPLPFPPLKRISIDLLNNKDARVRADRYVAVTSNTVQFGAALDVYFGLDGFSVSGNFSLDALFRLPPFGFTASIAASLSVNAFGVGMFSVSFSGTLEGASPWHIVGHGGISLLFWSLDVDFEHTWGDPIAALLESIAVIPLLIAELAKPESWQPLPPPGRAPSVTVRQAAPDELIIDPLGGLRIVQRALPLDIAIDRVGANTPSDATRLTVTAAGTGLARTADAQEQFALAQFRDLTDAEKLSQPAFTPEHAGLDLTSAGGDLRTSGMDRRSVRYEEIIIDSHFKRSSKPLRPYPGSLFTHFLTGGAVTRVETSQASQAALKPFAQVVTIAEDTYTVAFADTNRAYAPAAFSSPAGAADFVARTIAADPALAGTIHVIPTFEAAA